MVQGRVGTQSAGGTAGVDVDRGGRATSPRGLERWGRSMARRRWWVLGVWLLVLAVLGDAGVGVQNVFRDVFSVPGTNSQAATDLLASDSPHNSTRRRRSWCRSSGHGDQRRRAPPRSTRRSPRSANSRASRP